MKCDIVARLLWLLFASLTNTACGFAQVTTGNLLVNPGAESGEAPWVLDTRFTNLQNGPLSLPGGGVAIVATEGTHWFGGARSFMQDAGGPGFHTSQPAEAYQTIDVRTFPHVEAITVGMDAFGAGITIAGDSVPLVQPLVLLVFEDESSNVLGHDLFFCCPIIQLQSGTAISLTGLQSTMNVTPPSGTAIVRAHFKMDTGLGPHTSNTEVYVMAGFDNMFLSLTYTLVPGDYNSNGMVDAADYVVWRDRLGSGTSLPNDDTAGVGPDDFDRWRTHFGETAGGGSGSVSNTSGGVPEPSMFSLIAMAGLTMLVRRNRLQRPTCPR